MNSLLSTGLILGPTGTQVISGLILVPATTQAVCIRDYYDGKHGRVASKSFFKKVQEYLEP